MGAMPYGASPREFASRMRHPVRRVLGTVAEPCKSGARRNSRRFPMATVQPVNALDP